MIKTIRRILGGTVDAHVAEQHDLLIKCARRCAYDLGHAIDLIYLTGPTDHRRDLVEHLTRNQKHWIGLFKSGNHMKDYHHHLHNTIEKQEVTIDRLYRLLDEAGIEDPKDERLPF
jgi:hypothetical protein